MMIITNILKNTSYTFCIAIMLIFNSCSKDDQSAGRLESIEAETRGLSVGFGYEYAWLEEKAFRLSSSGLSKVKKLEKKYGKNPSKINREMSNTDFEYLAYYAERSNPGLCPTTTYNHKAKQKKYLSYKDKFCYKPSWCPDYTKASNYR
jgi:hypothetical protein